MLSKEKITPALVRFLTLALFLSTLSFLSSQSASANIPASARLIGNGQGSTSTIVNTNGLSATEFAKCASSTGIRGITSDGTHVYFRPSNSATIICKTTLSGVFVSANTVINSGQTKTFEMYSSESRALTFANGCILFRGGFNGDIDKGYLAGSDFMCVDTSNWTMYGPFTPTGQSVPVGGFWLTSNIMNFPDGRVGVVSAPNAGVGTGPACTATYCKYLRLYNVVRTGNSLSFAFDRDITLGDNVNSNWPDDDHGMATDGTYLYQIRYSNGYKVWQLSNTATSQVVFNGDGSGSCLATTGTSGTRCEINASVGWTSSPNATFFGRSHATNQYIMGDYSSNNRFWISASVAPPTGIGSDVTAPVLSAQSATSVTQTTATLNFTAGEAGTYFYLVYPSASSAPDSATVVSQGASAPTVVKGTSSATASANAVSVTGLSAGTAYKAYVVVRDSSGNVSLVSAISLTTVVASPAFTLSSSSETRTYATSGTAFTINSTGGLIASFSISATPPGMNFDTSTGTLTGAPTTVASATTYTVTATNVSGTATRNFVLTVAARPITIKAADKTTTYSGAAASIVNSYSITSGTLAGSDTFTALTYTYSSVALSYNSQTAPTNAATYTITPSAASFSVGSASNYTITYATGILTINKADSITVTATPSTTTYNASPITPAYLVSGLKGAETATVTSNFMGINGTSYGGGTTCETGGACSLGETGPGGGTVFYDAGITQSWGRYLEVAPVSWSAPSATADIFAPWGCDGTLIGASGSSIGSGFTNTNLILANCATAGIAARLVRAYAGGSKLDWSLPSTGELRALCAFATSGTASSCTGSASPRLGLAGSTYYYSSTEISSGGTDKFRMSDGQFTSAGKNSSTNLIRPIRAFDLVSASSITTPPTDAGSYRYTVTDIVISAGASLNNYQGVIYESATLTINKAFQAKLSVGQYDAYPGISSYPLNVYGGTGLGSVTRTLVDTGTAGCALSGILILTATNAGTCTVRAVKDGGANYFTETTTATIYWIPFINRYVSSAPATPTDLGLSGATVITKITYETFTVLSFANGSGTAVTSASKGSVMRINGTGFNASDETTEVIIGFFSIPRSSLTINTTNPLANFVEFTLPNSSDLDTGANDVAMKSRKGWAFALSLLNVTG
jgi:hypothetical protein